MSSGVLERRLDCGRLRLQVDQSWVPLDELCGFANRRNKKRGFLFVSKVLGKHYPVRPSRMREVYRELARQLGALPEPVVVVGMAETAIALAQGVHEELRAQGATDTLFLHSTRYAFARPQAFTFDESHSHAVQHYLYLPEAEEHRRLLDSAKTLVLVDDELTTGNTLTGFFARWKQSYPAVDQLRIVCLTNWLAETRRHEIAAQFPEVSVQFVSLLDGTFSFEPAAEFDCGPIASAEGRAELKDALIQTNFGRFGIQSLPPQPYDQWIEDVPLAGKKVLVLGTGEFMYPPFLFAEWLEERGVEVWFQSSTRSPIHVAEDIQSAVETRDNYGEEIPNFVYNLSMQEYDEIFIGYETLPIPPGHDLPAQLGARILEFRPCA